MIRKNKLHIGWHKTGTTYFQTKIFPQVPNYRGRIYGKRPFCNFRRFIKYFKERDPNGHDIDLVSTCRNVLEHFKTDSNIFISWEIFSKLRRQELLELLNDEWEVLVFSREINDLMRSRRYHYAHNFFLYSKISKGIIDDEIRVHYDVTSLEEQITDITVISYEKIFSGDLEEVARLSNFLEHDIMDLHLKHIDQIVNGSS